MTQPFKSKTCLIFGMDGFDLCVSINLTLYYASLGFRVFLSRTLFPADVLVLTRYQFPIEGCPKDFFKDIPLETPIHIYPYVGIHPRCFESALQGRPVTVFAPSEELRCNDTAGFTQIISFPPVWVPFWARRSEERVFPIVHIGNLKKRGEFADGWPECEALIHALSRADAHCWGSHGWENVSEVPNRHGELPIFEVPEVYARTKIALGLMYPYQRQSKTISSRFFQAPLCGAPILSEKDTRTDIPGVLPCGLDDIELKIQLVKKSHDEIQQEAITYWEQKRLYLNQQIMASFSNNPPLSTGKSPQDLTPVPEVFTAILQRTFGDHLLFLGDHTTAFGFSSL